MTLPFRGPAIALSTLLPCLLLLACGTPERPAGRPQLSDEPGMAGSAAARTSPPPPSTSSAMNVSIKDIDLTPNPPLATQDIRASLIWRGAVVEDSLDLEFEWTRNGKKIYGQSRATLPSGNLSRGDMVGVAVTARFPDGMEVTGSRDGLKVANATPEITTDFSNVNRFDGLKIEATDPDDDPIRFSLENPPPGFSIHPETGAMRVVAGNFPGGVFPMVIHAKDGFGGDGVAQVTISMTVGQEPKVETKKVERTIQGSKLGEAERDKRYEDTVNRIEKMTDQELDALEKKQEKAEGQ